MNFCFYFFLKQKMASVEFVRVVSELDTKDESVISNFLNPLFIFITENLQINTVTLWWTLIVIGFIYLVIIISR